MSEHPADTEQNRFRASVAGTLAFLSFGILAGLILCVSGLQDPVDRAQAGVFSARVVAERDRKTAEPRPRCTKLT